MRALVLAALCACAAAPHKNLPFDRDQEKPPIIEPLAPPITFGPVAHEASAFDEPLAGAPAPPVADNIYVERTREDDIFAGLAGFARARGILTRDARLDRVCVELAGVVPQGAKLSEGLVEFALHAHGIVEPAAHVVISHATTPAKVAADLAVQLGETLYFSNVRVGIGGPGPVVAIITYKAGATIASPRFVPSTSGFHLAAKLDPELHRPRVTITHDDGETEHPHVWFDADHTFHAAFTCGGRKRTQWIVLEADARPAPLALVPVSCGKTLPSTFIVEPSANLETKWIESSGSAGARSDAKRRGEWIEHRLAALINRERLAAHLAPLVTDPRATEAARRYAETMRRGKSVSHELEHTTPGSRLAAAGIGPPLFLESTMQANSLGRAAELLENEPLYRADVVSPLVTHLGIGIARNADNELYIAILYIQLVPPVDVPELTRLALDKIRAVYPRGIQIHIDPELGQVAQFLAIELAAGWRVETVWPRTGGALVSHFSAVDRSVTELVDVKLLDGKGLVPDPGTAGIGIGAAQSVRSGPLGGRIWIVVLRGARAKFGNH